MGDTRESKTKRGRISLSTRAIFYENLERALREYVVGKLKADKIRYLMKHAHVSRSQAQRYVEGSAMPADIVQAPDIDTLAFIAEAFGSNASQFLTQGCKFAKDRPLPKPDGPTPRNTAALGREALHRPPARRASRHPRS